MQVGALVGGSSEVVGPETTLFAASEALIANGIGSLAVVDDRALAGIITERDLVRATATGADPHESLVKDWMTVAPDTIAPNYLALVLAYDDGETLARHSASGPRLYISYFS